MLGSSSGGKKTCPTWKCVRVWRATAEMLTVSSRRVLLRDEDSSSAVIGKNERRLNTLAHYRVPDGCTLAVVTRYSTAARSNGQSTLVKSTQIG